MISYEYQNSLITYDENQNIWYYTNGTSSMMYRPSSGFYLQKENKKMESIPLLTDMKEEALFQEAMLYDAYVLKGAQEEIHKLRIKYENNKNN